MIGIYRFASSVNLSFQCATPKAIMKFHEEKECR